MNSQVYDDIIASLGLDLLPEDERNALLSDIGEVIFRGVMHKVWNSLDPTTQDQLTQLFDASNEDPENEQKREAIDQFLTANVPDLKLYVSQEVEALKTAQQDVYGEIMS